MELKNLLQGRLGRVRYFSYVLITLSVFTLLIVAYRNIFGALGDVMFAVIAAFFFAVVVLTIRRLHDLNLRGLWALLIPISFAVTIISTLYLINPFAPDGLFLANFTIWPMLSLYTVAFFLLFFRKGTAGLNRFGEEPSK